LTCFQLNYWNKLIGKVCTLLVILTYMYQDARDDKVNSAAVALLGKFISTEI
jgi:hypothetical protein